MSGLVAVLAIGREAAVDDGDLQRLVSCYEAVRGPCRATVARGGSRARAARLEPVGADGAAEDLPGSWPVTIGVPYARGGTAAGSAAWLRSVDWQFALVTYDATADEALAANDPMGMVAVYVAAGPGVLYVSTSSLALARFLAAPADRLAVQSFLLSGYHFGSRTHWQGIERLEPGQVVRVGSGGRSQELYWRPAVHHDVRRLPLRRAADHLIDVAVDVLRSRLDRREECWIDLTGGFDSRLLGLLLSRADVPFRANTRHTRDPADVAIARRISEVKGWAWVDPALPEDWDAVLPDEIGPALAWGDGQLEVLQLSRVQWVHRPGSPSSPPPAGRPGSTSTTGSTCG
jgi:hypothetical protein